LRTLFVLSANVTQVFFGHLRDRAAVRGKNVSKFEEQPLTASRRIGNRLGKIALQSLGNNRGITSGSKFLVTKLLTTVG
jgi:hypothetical protein